MQIQIIKTTIVELNYKRKKGNKNNYKNKKGYKQKGFSVRWCSEATSPHPLTMSGKKKKKKKKTPHRTHI